MTTDTDKLAILAKYQCCYAELAGEVSAKLGKHKLCDLQDFSSHITMPAGMAEAKKGFLGKI